VRLRIDLGYDGGAFHGWARQPGLRTVQGTSLTVAGRTDTGVHARHQVTHLDLEAELVRAVVGRSADAPAAALVRRANGVLEHDVRLHRVTEAPAGFDARFSARWRRYAYRIADTAAAVDPLTRRHVLTWPQRLDDSAMQQAARALLGEHDFAAFCRKRAGATTIRTLLDLGWVRQADGVLVGTVRADAFCHNMVRALVGCLVAVGEGRRDAAWAAEVLDGRRRDPAVTVVPAHGLTLEEVDYPADDELAARAAVTRARRDAR
jgi:tRNA pseudouridine38-40 synthase